MARQQRAFAELLEQGLTRGPLVLPSYHQRLVSAAASSSSVNVNSVEGDAMKELGMNPSQALHHPGFYYHVAARCTEVRRERFLAAFEAEVCDVSFCPFLVEVSERIILRLAIFPGTPVNTGTQFRPVARLRQREANQPPSGHS
jgi:hypothetical protein